MQYKFHQQCIFFFTGSFVIFFDQGVQAIHGYLDQMWGQAMAGFQAEAERAASQASAGPQNTISNHSQEEP